MITSSKPGGFRSGVEYRNPLSYRHHLDAAVGSGRSVLSTAELAGFAVFVAAEVAAGRYPFIEYDEHERWHQRIYRDPRVDLWLISWLPSQGTQLHDHGGSSGAFAVVEGVLDEASYQRRGVQPGGLTDRRRSTGQTSTFGAHYVHDVRNLAELPAVSVHAYSPPLTLMNYYDVDDAGELVRIASLQTDDPETAFTPEAVSDHAPGHDPAIANDAAAA